MKKQRTWILLALFVALAGYAIYSKNNPKTEKPDPDATPSATIAPVEFLLPANQGVITSLLIESREGERVRVVRGADGWVLVQPLEAEADQASAEAAASQVTALTVLSQVEVDPDVVGLKSPMYIIKVGFSSGKSTIIKIGDATPTDTGYYVSKEDGSVLVIDKYGMDALLNLLLYPPFLETPTPSPVPSTKTPTPPTASETPTVTKMP